MLNEYEGSRLEFLKILVEQGEEPAFLRRSRIVTEALEQLHRDLRSQRRHLLGGARLKLHVLADRLRCDWSKLGDYLADSSDCIFYEELFKEWELASKSPGAAIGSWLRPTRFLLSDFHHSVVRLNQLWEQHLDRVDLSEINRMLRNYNEYYPMEKTCAFDCQDIDRLGFMATRPMTREELDQEYPPISLPELRNAKPSRG